MAPHTPTCNTYTEPALFASTEQEAYLIPGQMLHVHTKFAYVWS